MESVVQSFFFGSGVTNEYYEAVDSRKEFENRNEEADKVAVRITEILSENTFNFLLIVFYIILLLLNIDIIVCLFNCLFYF